MAGHSKWKNIRLHKGKADIERGKIFGKLSREITIAARGGGNPDGNPRLRLAIEKAREKSMPVDNIKRAVQRGTGEVEGASYEEATYEGYGPGGAAVLVQAATDNRNRTVADLRFLFSKHGGNLGESGSVAWQFQQKAVIELASGDYSEEDVMDAALEGGADDVQSDDDGFTITADAEVLADLRAHLAAKFQIESAEIEMVPQTPVALEGDDAKKMMKLMDALDDHDDVQSVASNFEMSDELLEEATS
ncbi:MAG: YebC/PmpR family DNA-binding transcriptional regulator [Acidimicrobiales bacterium]